MLKIDLHLHTIASGHAYSTILEYVNRANDLKMSIIGFADHGPALRSSLTNEIYFSCLYRIPREVGGLVILKGVEVNILGIDGKIDISDKIIKNLDFVIAGFHQGADCGFENNIENNTKAMISVIESGKVDIISHLYFTDYHKVNIEVVSRAACEHDVLLEINMHYLKDRKIAADTFVDLKKMIDIVRQYQQKIIVNSDAHNIWEMADDTPLKKVQSKIGLTDEMIINNYPEEILKRFKAEDK